jgi:hypothetical protein
MQDQCGRLKWLFIDLSWIFLSAVVSVIFSISYAQELKEQPELAQYRDPQYGYSFRYPANWQLRNLPEGAANEDIRVLLQSPKGNSFMVIVEKRGQNMSKSEFDADAGRQSQINQLMQQTSDQIYQTIAKNMRAVESKIGERTDLSNEAGIKYYISTWHKLKTGKPVIVAGIHCHPFSKNYSVNFMMTAFFDSAAEKDNAMMTVVFNSFRLLEESPANLAPDVDSKSAPQ